MELKFIFSNFHTGKVLNSESNGRKIKKPLHEIYVSVKFGHLIHPGMMKFKSSTLQTL